MLGSLKTVILNLKSIISLKTLKVKDIGIFFSVLFPVISCKLYLVRCYVTEKNWHFYPTRHTRQAKYCLLLMFKFCYFYDKLFNIYRCFLQVTSINHYWNIIKFTFALSKEVKNSCAFIYIYSVHLMKYRINTYQLK
jgi:hypothetical protein